MPGRKKPKAKSEPKPAAAAAVVTHDMLMQSAIRVDPELRRRSQLLWEERAQSARGPKAALTPDEVVQAAMAIADESGIAAVTMSAVSARIGYTTMAVYRYFPSKEALLDAIVDAALGQPPAPPEPRGDWRAELANWARAKRAMLCSRPWLAELPFVAAPHGPNWLSWLEAVIDSLSVTSLSAADKGEVLSILDGYTRGASDTAVSLARARARGTSDAEWAAAVGADLGRAIGDPRFPKFAELITTPPQGPPRSFDESFEFGLARVLDGIERYVNQAMV